MDIILSYPHCCSYTPSLTLHWTLCPIQDFDLLQNGALSVSVQPFTAIILDMNVFLNSVHTVYSICDLCGDIVYMILYGD